LSEVARKAERAFEGVEQQIAALEAEADRPSSPSYDEQLQAIERRFEQDLCAPDRPGLIAQLRARFTAWRRRRRHRLMVRRLERMLARRDVRLADQTSAALLAVLTERVARISATDVPLAEIEATAQLAQRISDEYRDFVARLAAARDGAADPSEMRDKATTALARCKAGLFRIDDALAQLRALVKRKTPRAQSGEPRGPPSGG
jgi:hypothetical protein